MNRIKYRVWDNAKKRFIKDYVGIRPDGSVVVCNIWYDDDAGQEFGGYLDESWTDIDDKNQYEIQQFTGLTDSKGREIYEGDIVKYISRSNHKITHYQIEVKYEDSGRWNVSQSSGMSPDCYFDIEVIGNIYGNEELLK